MKVGFSGVGNMSSAIIHGLLQQNLSAVSSLHAFSPSGPKSEKPMHQQLHWHASNSALAQAVDVMILGVKPKMIPAVLNEIRSTTDLPLVVSLAAGITTSTMEQHLGEQPKKPAIIRTMPNTPSAVGAGMTGLFANKEVDTDQRDFTQTLFSSIGEVLWLSDEDKFHALTAISGSGPAYFFQFTNAMILAGMEKGLSKEEATLLAVQTAKGAGLLMAETGKPPAQLQQEVTSPNGTTYAATEVLRKGNIDTLVMSALGAAHDRSVELSQA